MSIKKTLTASLAVLLATGTLVQGAAPSPGFAQTRSIHQPGSRAGVLDFDQLPDAAVLRLDHEALAQNALLFEQVVAFVIGERVPDDGVVGPFLRETQRVFERLNTPQPYPLLGSISLGRGVNPTAGGIVNAILPSFGRDVSSIRVSELRVEGDRGYFKVELMVNEGGLQMMFERSAAVAINRIPINRRPPSPSSPPQTGPYLFTRPVSINFDPVSGYFASRDSQAVSLRLETGNSIRTQFGTGILAQVPNPRREGYSFRGWYSQGIRLTQDTVINQNMIVVAEWRATTN